MSSTILTCIVFSFITLYCTTVTGRHIHKSAENNRPIIGILTQELSYSQKAKYGSHYDSYIAASYVKFVEGAGARAIPIWIGMPEVYYEEIMSEINGVLLPGGGAAFNRANGYGAAGNHIYKIATRMNKNDEYFPILGICLGFEFLTYVAAKGNDPRIPCSSSSQPLQLEFEPGFNNSRLFGNAPKDILEILENEKVTANFHRQCVTKQGLKTASINNVFRVLSVNSDTNGISFISSLEHVTFPFYGLQFHPEKNLYEWVTGKRIPHGDHPTQSSRYFAEFFVNEARKSAHRFANKEREQSLLIYNYEPTYTGRNSSFEQIYLFALTYGLTY
ncbi:gamma-glutamyl hydrolase-like [Megachile rotundata]|uniref:gamma-glutamyl hydrolase-like n=1 Tax=Megachile rotundata TaxID=143995 RepID=UPI000258D924|nr:PREDICTED: gamma-glutamyl hydrolase-like [Megachile rotundata]